MNWNRAMDRTYWHRQAPDKPLYPNLLWSRPEHKRQAGKLLVAGGSSHGFAAPAEAYTGAVKAGVGTVRVLLPDSLQKTIGKSFAAGEFAPSTPSGSFSQAALAELVAASQWADGVLLAGDFGHSSETAVLLEKFAQEYDGPLALSQDAVDNFSGANAAITDRPDTLLATEFAQLQKLAQAVRFPTAFTSAMDLLHCIDTLHEFTAQHKIGIITHHLGSNIVVVGGQVSTTKGPQDSFVAIAAHAAVWWLQNPAKPFEAITTSLVEP